jgi:hypothetical protein
MQRKNNTMVQAKHSQSTNHDIPETQTVLSRQRTCRQVAEEVTDKSQTNRHTYTERESKKWCVSDLGSRFRGGHAALLLVNGDFLLFGRTSLCLSVLLLCSASRGCSWDRHRPQSPQGKRRVKRQSSELCPLKPRKTLNPKPRKSEYEHEELRTFLP